MRIELVLQDFMSQHSPMSRPATPRLVSRTKHSRLEHLIDPASGYGEYFCRYHGSDIVLVPHKSFQPIPAIRFLIMSKKIAFPSAFIFTA
jgi:hypothetical protein